MPKIHRSMLVDGDKPKVGDGSKMLGVRIAPNPHADIAVDDLGAVHPQTGGMSVVPHWRMLPPHLIPERLKLLAPDAHGSNKLVCWTMGDGTFATSTMTETLRLRVDTSRPDRHGFVEPAQEMSIDVFQSALAGTRGLWARDES